MSADTYYIFAAITLVASAINFSADDKPGGLILGGLSMLNMLFALGMAISS